MSAATSAACGVLTPMPCVPVPAGPWKPGGKQLVSNFPALLDNCTLSCAWGGSISIKSPGHTANIEGK